MCKSYFYTVPNYESSYESIITHLLLLVYRIFRYSSLAGQ